MAQKEVKYEIDPNDPRLQEVNAEETAALGENDETYGGMIGNTDKFYQEQIDVVKDYEKTQVGLQNEQTDFAIDKIEQQKAQAQKDYIKEQSGAFTDWQKQSNAYGVNAEKQAAAGLQNSGFAESSQVSMYNTYQNRVATARDVFQRATLNYNNAIAEARLQNNVALAKIAVESLRQQLELALQGFQYKNTLVLEQAKSKRDIRQTYHSQYMDVLQQLNTENALAEEVRQFNAQMEEEKRQFDILHPANVGGISGTNGGAGTIGGSGGGSGKGETKGAKAAGKDSSSIREGKGNGSSTTSSNGGSTVSSNGKSPETPTVDMQSVLSLGYGPITASKLNDLIKQGEVEEYQEGNKLKYRKKLKA